MERLNNANNTTYNNNGSSILLENDQDYHNNNSSVTKPIAAIATRTKTSDSAISLERQSIIAPSVEDISFDKG